MPFAKKLAALAAFGLLALPALTVHAAQGDVTDISFRDLDHNGRIERAVITFSNPNRQEFAVTDVSRLKVWYGDKSLVPTAAYLATSGDPAKIVVIWSQDDANLPVDTGTGNFAIEWSDFGITKSAPKSDLAAPMLVASTPVAGRLNYGRAQNVVLTFSEAIDPAKFAFTAQQDVAGWATSWSADGRVATLQHNKYGASARVTFTVTQATDVAGNLVVPGIYANPFSFVHTASDSSNPSGSVDSVFTINEPRANATLIASRPNVIAWYTNLPDVAQVRIKWSVDGGSSFNLIDTYPVTRGAVLWYPPNMLGTFALKLEGLSAAGALVAVDTRSPLSLTGEAGNVEMGTEEHVPGLPNAAPSTPSQPAAPAPNANDKTAPKIVGNVVLDQLNAVERTARLSWVTDEPSTGGVIYGALKDYSYTTSDSVFGTSHTMTLSGLTPGIIHNLRLTVTDASGNAYTTNDIFLSFYKEGDLVKGSGTAVYWVHNGKRDVFPNSQIYFTWFTDFSKVIRIGDEQLAGLLLGTNVKVKGGTKLVKIQSDPKTYSVDDNGVLHWVQTEARAVQLYGSTWNKNVIDLDVSFFAGYTIGDPA